MALDFWDCFGRKNCLITEKNGTRKAIPMFCKQQHRQNPMDFSNMKADPLLFPYTEMHIFHGVCPIKQQIMVFKSTRAPVTKRFC